MTDPLEVVRTIYDRFEAADIDGLMALASPDIVLRQDPGLPWGGEYHGRDGLIDFAMKLLGATDSAIATEQLFAAGDSVVQLGRSSGTVRETGAAFDVPECHVWTFRDGVVAEAQFFLDSTTMLEVLGR